MSNVNPELVDSLAAEYVLGTLQGDARDRFEKLLESDPHVAERVREWELRLAPLAEELDEVEPPNHSWQQIDTALFGRAQTAASTNTNARPWWQWASFALFGTVLALVGVVAKLAHEVAHPSQCYVVLTDDARAPGLVVFDRENMAELVALPVGNALAQSAGRPALWIEAEGARYRVGSLASDTTTEFKIDKQRSGALMKAGARMIVIYESSGAVADAPPIATAFSGAIAFLPPKKT